MEWVEIALFILSGFTTMLTTWAVFVTNKIFELDKSVALNRQDDDGVKTMVYQINSRLGKIEEDLSEMKLLMAANKIRK